jgi:hypothetical protein
MGAQGLPVFHLTVAAVIYWIASINVGSASLPTRFTLRDTGYLQQVFQRGLKQFRPRRAC